MPPRFSGIPSSSISQNPTKGENSAVALADTTAERRHLATAVALTEGSVGDTVLRADAKELRMILGGQELPGGGPAE